MIDHIGTNRVSIRKITDGISIRLLNTNGGSREGTLDMTPEEWFDLCSLLQGIKAVVDFQDEYGKRP